MKSKILSVLLLIALTCGSTRVNAGIDTSLFPSDLAERQWVDFKARGYQVPVSGVIYGKNTPAVCGMPIGGIDVGCIDLETNGTWGYCSIFNSLYPRRGPLNLPILGLSVGMDSWILSTMKLNSEPATQPPSALINHKRGASATEIHYWGHYPVADVEFETSAPVSVGLRAWSPFLPGDVITSAMPGSVFEVHLKNTSSKEQQGALVFSFPGPSSQEVQGDNNFKHTGIQQENLSGVVVTNPSGTNYAIGVIGKEPSLRAGGDLGVDGGAWSRLAIELPAVTGQAGASVSVDFNLKSNEEKIIRFVLAWYSPRWDGQGRPTKTARRGIAGDWFSGSVMQDGSSVYTHMYAKWYPDALEVATILAKRHEELLGKIIAWQEEIYKEPKLPAFLKEALVNNFHLITEVGVWAQAKAPIGAWCKPEDGIWALNESPRGCPQMECLGNAYYGGLADLYFFPKLTLSTMRAYKAYQFPDGCPPWVFSGVTTEPGTPPYDLVHPNKGYQKGQNGSFYVGIVYRYWMATGDDAVLKEFYPSLKAVTDYIMNLNPEQPYGLISLPTFDLQEAYESTPFKGMASHVGIIRLYHLKVMEKIATKMGDHAYAATCKAWYDQASRLLEQYLWTGSYYRQHKDVATGDFSDVVMAYQLDGEVMARYDALAQNVLPENRVKSTLEVIRKVCMLPWGPRVWSNPDGSPPKFETGYWTPRGVHAPGAILLAMMYMYDGQTAFGTAMIKKILENLILKNGYAWDMPILYDGETGAVMYGNDYAQMMMIWALPAPFLGQNIQTFTRPGGLRDRIINAAAGK